MNNDHPICVWCGKPRANYEDWDTIAGGDGDHLCWEDSDRPEVVCETVDLFECVSELRARITELEKDKEIIDWMSRKDGYTAVWMWDYWRVDVDDHPGLSTGNTAREALLKAMAMGKARDGE